MNKLKKYILIISIFTLLSFIANAEKKENFNYTCTNTEINTIYIPILQEVVEWPTDQIRPYAIELCKLTKEKVDLQKSIKNRADYLRTSNFRVCKEVISGNPNPTPSECKAAYNEKINSLIDNCINLVEIGHNPHNVLLILDPIRVEVGCLKGVNIALQTKLVFR